MKHQHPTKKVDTKVYWQGTTPFGTDKSLVVGESANTGKVICKDEGGYYETEQKCVNSGLADPHRRGTGTWGYPDSRLTEDQAKALLVETAGETKKED